MEIRLTSKATSGRPWLTRAILLALLAGLAAVAVTISRRRASAPVILAEPVLIEELGVLVRPPANWLKVIHQPATPGVRMFIEAGPERQAARQLWAIRLDGSRGAEALLAEYLGHADEPVGQLTPARIGPLPGRQAVLRGRPPRQTMQILRIAPVGAGQNLLLVLDCIGPPLPAEYQLMETIASAVRIDPRLALSDDRLAELGLSLGDSSGDWLALATHRPGQIVLLPRADRLGDSAWGHARLTVTPVATRQPLEPLARDFAESGLASADGAPLWRPGVLGAPLAARIGTVTVDKFNPSSGAGAEPGWQISSPARDEGRVTYLFHPRESDTATADDLAAWLQGWLAGDEPRAALAKVATSLRATVQPGADPVAARERARQWLTRIASDGPLPTSLRTPTERLFAEIGEQGSLRGQAVIKTIPTTAGWVGSWQVKRVEGADRSGTWQIECNTWQYARLPSSLRQQVRFLLDGRRLEELSVWTDENEVRSWWGHESGEARLARPQTFLPDPLIQAAIEAAVTTGRPMRFELAGPTSGRLAVLTINPQPAERGGGRALLWFDYDPEPTEAWLDGRGVVHRFSRSGRLWRTVENGLGRAR